MALSSWRFLLVYDFGLMPQVSNELKQVLELWKKLKETEGVLHICQKKSRMLLKFQGFSDIYLEFIHVNF
jgi:hypothetical protein